MNTLTEKEIGKLVKNKSSIRPFAEVNSHSEPVFDKLGFDITSIHLDKTKDGWLRVYITWSAKKDEYKFKYPIKGCSSYGYGENSVELEFPQVKSKYKQSDGEFAPCDIEVGICTVNDKKLDYSFKFIENLSYGCLVWFAPKNWNNGLGEMAMFEFNEIEKSRNVFFLPRKGGEKTIRIGGGRK